MRAITAFAIFSLTLALVPDSPGQYAQQAVVYRYYNSAGADHLYTINPWGEARATMTGYALDGPAFRVFTQPLQGYVPLFRFRKPDGSHFYTTERVEGRGFYYEGVLGFISPVPRWGHAPLYRWYNPGTGRHFYTTDPAGELAPYLGYVNENAVGYVVPW